MDDHKPNEIPRIKDDLTQLMIELLEEDPNAAAMIHEAWRHAAEHVVSQPDRAG